MKNSKFTKITLLVLSLALVIGAAIGFSVSAEDSAAPAIVAQNVVLGDRVAIAYAIDVAIEDAATVEVTYYWDNDSANVKKATLLDTTKAENLAEIDGVKYPVFVTEGVAPKELAKVANVSTDGGKTYMTYSVAEYLYIRLYQDGFVNKTVADGKDYNRKLLYNNLLDYAAQAQMVFDCNTDKLVTGYSFAYTDSELITLAKGDYVFGYGAISVEGTVIGEGTIAGWTVTDLKNGGETESEDVIVSLTGAYKVEPIFGVHECVDEDNDHLCDSCGEVASACVNNNATVDHKCDICGKVVDACVDANTDGKCDVCYVYNFNVESMQQSEQLTIYNVAWNGKDTAVDSNFSSSTTLTTSQNRPDGFGSGEWFSLVKNPTDAADTVLQFNSVYKSGNTEKSHITFAPTVAVENGDLVVFEFDFYHVSGASSKNPIRFYDIYADGTASADYTPTYTNSNNIAVSIGTKPTFAKETWVRYRLVYNNSNDTIYWYYSVDGGAAYTFAGTAAYKAASDIVAVGFRGNNVWNGNSTLLFDNIKCVKTTAEAYGITLN